MRSDFQWPVLADTKCFGPAASFTAERSGSLITTVTARFGGRVAVSTDTVPIASQIDYFTATRMFYVDADMVVADAPAGAKLQRHSTRRSRRQEAEREPPFI